MYKAELISGDFEDNTMTFEVKGEMTLKSGKYIILTKDEYNRKEKINNQYGKFFDKVVSDGQNPEEAARDLKLL